MRINLIQHAWLILLIKGIISILFGLLAIFHPGLTLALLMTFLGIYICLNGVLTLLATDYYTRYRGKDQKWQGLINIIIGFILILWPAQSAVLFVFFVAAWIILMGFFQIMTYINYKAIFGNNIALVILGILALLLGFFIVRHPHGTLAVFIWLVGLYAFITGIASIIFAIQLKKDTKIE